MNRIARSSPAGNAEYQKANGFWSIGTILRRVRMTNEMTTELGFSFTDCQTRRAPAIANSTIIQHIQVDEFPGLRRSPRTNRQPMVEEHDRFGLIRSMPS